MGAPAAGPVAADEQLAAPTATAPPPRGAGGRGPAATARHRRRAHLPQTRRAENATAATAQRSALSSATVLTSESTAPGEPADSLAHSRQHVARALERRWQIVDADDGPAPNLAAVRAVDADRAVVTTSDKAEFYTTNGGQSWTRVQENSAAPF